MVDHSPIAGPRYRQHAPPEGTASVAAVWRVRGAGELPIWPDGCVDFIARFGPEGTRVLVTPPTLRAGRAIVGPGDVVVGVRLRPGAAAGLLGDDAPEATARLARRVAVEGPMALLDAARDAAGPPPTVRLALRALVQTGGAIRVGELARDLGVSERTLARLFAQHVGASPKALARVARARRALRALSHQGVELGPLAQALGLADQAHLTRETVELLGATPGDLRGIAPPSPISSRIPAPAGAMLMPWQALDT